MNIIGASEHMETELHRCTSCGAELIMSSLDMSTACVFCGQSTICSENVEKRKKPDYIIPLSVTNEQAKSRV